MVRGSVPFDDAELKAVKSAGESALAYAIGSRRATNFRIRGRTMSACVARAATTVRRYQKSDLKTAGPCVAVTKSIRHKTPRGASAMMAIVIAIMTSKPASAAVRIAPSVFPPTMTAKIENARVNEMIERKCESAIAAIGFVGIMRSTCSKSRVPRDCPPDTSASTGAAALSVIPGRKMLTATKPIVIAAALVQT